MNKLLLKGVAAAFCMATMFGTTACGDDDDLVNVEPPVEETQDVISVSYTHLTLPTKRIV